MAFSGTYNFLLPQSDLLITEAYERIGVVPSAIDPDQIRSGERAINFILSNWINEGNNLWTIRSGMIGLSPWITQYDLPPQLSDVKTAVLRTSIRALNGTPASSPGGTAANAFDGNPATSCLLTGIDGEISYQWGTLANPSYNRILLVGIQAAIGTSDTYTLMIEYYNGQVAPVDEDWQPVFDTKGAAWTATPQVYPGGSIQWFSIQMPPANFIRIRETGGATLNIGELYFNNNVQDTTMSPLSSFEYAVIPNKYTNNSKPLNYWVNRQIKPVLNIYPSPFPISLYNCIYYTYWSGLQDLNALLQSAEIPFRFLEALVSALAYNLGLKKPDLPPDKLALLKADAAAAYALAGIEDTEKVPMRIYANYDGYYFS